MKKGRESTNLSLDFENSKRNKIFIEISSDSDTYSEYIINNEKLCAPIYLNKLRHENPNKKKLTFRSLFEPDSESNSKLINWQIEHILIAGYIIDMEWIINELMEGGVFVHNEIDYLLFTCSNQGDKMNNSNYLYGLKIANNIEIYSPYLQLPYGVFHSKFMLIIFKHFKDNKQDFIRFIITSANFIKHDWEDKSQFIWVQDFLRNAELNDRCEFKSYFLEFFQHTFSRSKQKQLWIKKIREFDFTDATVKLIASVPGYFKEIQQINKWGHMRVRTLLDNIKNEQKEANSDLFQEKEHFVLQFSSLGRISEKWFYKEFISSFSKYFRESQDNHRINLQILFPTIDQVIESQEGILGGSSLPVKHNYINKPWIRKLLHRWENKHSLSKIYEREVIPHTKTYLKYRLIKGHPPQIVWIIQGSHNLSSAAWGQLQKNKTQFCIRNYELGIFIHKDIFCYEQYHGNVNNGLKEPKFLWRERKTGFNITNSPDRHEHSLNVVLPFRIPPEPYKNQDAPWFIELLKED